MIISFLYPLFDYLALASGNVKSPNDTSTFESFPDKKNESIDNDNEEKENESIELASKSYSID